MRKRILLVGDYNRMDFIQVAREMKDQAEFFFIEHISDHQLKNKECLKYGQVLYWKDFDNAYELLKRVKPGKVVFYFIESYNHVALNIACKEFQIPTYHLEHGLRFSVDFIKKVYNNRQPVRFTTQLLKRLSEWKSWSSKFRHRNFFQASVNQSTGNKKEFLRKFYEVRSRNNIYDTAQIMHHPLRWPDIYISFSQVVFNFHREFERLPEGYPVHFIGVPSFDSFHQWKNIIPSGHNILFIDQPFFEQKLFGWTREYKDWFLKELVFLARQLGKKLFIKPHPLNDRSLYGIYQYEPDIVLVGNAWDNVVPDIDSVIGFSSTLLLPFMAMIHTGCIAMEIHPIAQERYYSQFLEKSGVIDTVSSFGALKEKLENRAKWYAKQALVKESFIREWMYCFDGKSTERLKKILLEDEAV